GARSTQVSPSRFVISSAAPQSKHAGIVQPAIDPSATRRPATTMLASSPLPSAPAPLPRIGLALPHYEGSFPDPRATLTFARVASYAERAEALGFFELWASDHFWIDMVRYGGPPERRHPLECWTLLAGLATRTTTVRLGSLVLAVGFRSPTLLAKMA